MATIQNNHPGTVTITVDEYLQLLKTKDQFNTLTSDPEMAIVVRSHDWWDRQEITVIRADAAIKELFKEHEQIVKNFNARVHALEGKCLPIFNFTGKKVMDLK